MIARLAAAVRRRELSAVEAVTRCLERIEAADGAINAVVALRPDEALADARELDARLARGEDAGPLCGAPALVKDIEDVAGMRTTHGSLLCAHAPPAAEDGLVPGRLRRAGAIVVGKTNTPEFAYESYTANRLFGATGNPWDPALSPGGSSGGSAAALIAGLAPIATGTDGGGSVRIPAAFCGLVGLKPTNGVIGRRPIPAWMDLSTDGPMATCVRDVELLLGVEAGPVAGDPAALPGPLGAGDPAPLPTRVLAAPRLVDWGPLPAEIQAAFDRALALLEDRLGLPVEPIGARHAADGENPDADWYVLCAAEQAHQLGRELITAQADRFDPGFLAWMHEGLETSLEDYLAIRRRRFDHVRGYDELLGADRVLATPTMAIAGLSADGVLPGHEQPGSRPDVCDTPVSNITGHPAISVPAGSLPNGLPFGLQLIGPRFRDDLLLRLAASWEQAAPWPVTADGYEPFWRSE